MMLVKRTRLKSLFACILLCIVAIGSLWFVAASLAQAKPPVESIALATTVLIGAQLNENDVEKKNEDGGAGSGVIIARQEKSQRTLAAGKGIGKDNEHLLYLYWVLTSAHVVDKDTSNAKYGIRTADGKVYNIAGTTDLADTTDQQGKAYLAKPQVHRFGEGCATSENRSCFDGTDLAVFTFYSEHKYPVAALGDFAALTAKIQKGEHPEILVSGWPLPPNEEAKRVWFATIGNIVRVLPPEQRKPGNYNLVTTLRTKVGISGGPVFNLQTGELLGIYGSGPKVNEAIGDNTYAIDIGQFINLQSTEAAYTNTFNPSPPLMAPTPGNDQPAMQAEASEFAKTYAYTGRNMSPEEFKKLYLADLLPDDPRRKAIEVLDKLGCWTNYDDKTSGGGLQSIRGQYVNDVNQCLDSFQEKLAEKLAQSGQPNDFVSAGDLEILDSKVQKLAARLAKLSKSR